MISFSRVSIASLDCPCALSFSADAALAAAGVGLGWINLCGVALCSAVIAGQLGSCPGLQDTRGSLGQ